MIVVTLTTQGVFTRALEAAYATHPHADALTPPADLPCVSGTRFYVTPDKRSGFAVNPDGYGFSLFSTVKGRGDELVSAAIRVGVRTLDCFDGYLPTLYVRHGFVVTRREANWTPGGPDVVWMALKA